MRKKYGSSNKSNIDTAIVLDMAKEEIDKHHLQEREVYEVNSLGAGRGKGGGGGQIKHPQSMYR